MEILTQMDVFEDYYRTLQTNIHFEIRYFLMRIYLLRLLKLQFSKFKYMFMYMFQV